MTSTTPPALETDACRGTFVLAVPNPTRPGFRYQPCPGCVGCDYEAVSVRMAAKAPADPFARLPKIDEEAW